MAQLNTPLLLTGILALCGLVGWAAARMIVGAISPLPDSPGVTNGQFAPCPATPNCVSSQDTDPDHKVEPIVYSGAMDKARTKIINILSGLPRTNIVTSSPDYIHAVSRSRTFDFIDDTEIYFDQTANLIHIRAAARLGKGDLGVNRSRVEQINRAFQTLN